ncbi:MAG: sigma-54 dependent transcriptional regulator [Myxococcota bacterium]
MKKRNVLMVDDDTLLTRAVVDHLSSGETDVLTAHSASDAMRICAERAVDVVILDQRLPDGPGHALCQPILQMQPTAKIIFITAFPSFDNAVKALKAGAHDYLSKPFDLGELHHAVSRCLKVLELEKVERVHAYRTTRDGQEVSLIAGPGMDAVRAMIDVAARVDAPVLVTGETGTGKNLVAKAIHHGGARRSRPFISLNLASVPENLIEAELFGWERGAFTGADRGRDGLVEMAEGGTLFLDEVGEMPLHLQAKLLTVLEEKEIRRLGGRSTRVADVRILAATKADLDELVKARRFRSDLYYRLNVIRVHLPPLRERTSDLPRLCIHLLERMTGPGRAPQLAPGELEVLMAYPWPGNVRELRNVLERSHLLHHAPLRPSELLATEPRAPATEPFRSGVARAAEQDGKARPPAGQENVTPLTSEELSLEQVERGHIERVFHRHGRNLARTARALAISLSTLKRKVKRYGLRDDTEASGDAVAAGPG